MLKIWIDIKNSHEPAFFKSFLNEFVDYTYYISSREYAEIQKLLEQMGIQNDVIGRYYEGNKFKKIFGLMKRDVLLLLNTPYFDISLSHGSVHAVNVAKMRQKKTICFIDNEKAGSANKVLLRFVDYLITPNALPINNLIEQGAKEDNIIQYNGYKEDIYVADFEPNSKLLNGLPFNDFITIRPEALKAAYVNDKHSIVPDLLKAFNKEGINILYLPRYETDRNFAKGIDVFMPPTVLRGLDVCYYSDAILTGSGTFAREAACMGTPAVSFYPEELLAVDQKMVGEGRIFHSRDQEEIVDYVLSCKKRKVDTSGSKKVQREVFKIFGEIISEIEC